MDEGRGGWNSGPPPNEMRQMDWVSRDLNLINFFGNLIWDLVKRNL